MTHQTKLCTTAIVGHIETCFPRFSFAPLVHSGSSSSSRGGEESTAVGLAAVTEAEIRERGSEQFARVDEEFDAAEGELTERVRALSSMLSHFEIPMPDVETELRSELIDHHAARIAEVRAAVVADHPALDIRRPAELLDRRAEVVRERLDSVKPADIKFNASTTPLCESEDFGLFFQESLCFRSGGLVFEPCGEVTSILPGQTLTSSNVLRSETVDSETNMVAVQESLMTTEQHTTKESLTDAFERVVRRESDLSLSASGGVAAGVSFANLTLGMFRSFSGSYDFKKYMQDVDKSSREITREQVRKAVVELKSQRSTTSSVTTTLMEESAHETTWTNESDQVQSYIRRRAHCKSAAIHSRHNVMLAWKGCIENPSEGMCTPDNIEATMKPAVDQIKATWQKASPPAQFGSRPANEVRETGRVLYSSRTGKGKKLVANGIVPAGYSYAGGAQAIVVWQNNDVKNVWIENPTPPTGATGAVAFFVAIELENKLGLTEAAQFVVRYYVAPAAAKAWDEKVQAWRDEQAQAEIDALIKSKLEAAAQILFTDQLRAHIVRRIAEEYFAYSGDSDCCELIERLLRLFDFDKLALQLLPPWNQTNEACASAQPVNWYTASCAHFVLPIIPGRERDAVETLLGAGAVGYSFISEVFGYIDQIRADREELYSTAFDPTGWDVKFDRPNGFEWTPYNSTKPDWMSDFESNLRRQVIDAWTVITPTDGFRIDPVDDLCSAQQPPRTPTPRPAARKAPTKK